MARTPFIWGQGGQAIEMTPEQVARRREMAMALAGQSADFSPVGHWTQALARGLGGYLSGRSERIADDAEAAGMAEAEAIAAPYLGGGGGMSPVADALAGNNFVAHQQQSAPQFAPDGSIIRQGLIDRGLPEHVADAFVMNFQDESGLNPGINEQNPIVAGSRGGFGLAQWTGPRRRQLEAFAQQRGTPVSDMNTQLDFLMMELQGPESRAAQSILSAPDTGSAAAAIVNRFLRPAEEHRARREASYLGRGGGGSVAQALAPMTGGGPSSAELLQVAASNPWVAQRYGPVLEALAGQSERRENAILEQQMRQADPMYQAQLQGQMIQNQAAMQPQPVDPFAGTQVINGQLVGMGPQGPQVLGDFNTPEQTSAMQNYEFLMAQGMDPQTAMDRAFSGGVTVNNNMGQDQFDEAFAKGDAATIGDISSSGLAAQRNMSRIDQLEGLLNESPSGFSAVAAQRAGEWGINTEGLDNLQAAQAIINSLVPEQRQPGSGPMSDADLELFKQSLPRLINQPGGNQRIINTMRGIAQYDAEGAEIVQRLRAGQIDRATAFQMLQSRQNPMAGFEVPPQVETAQDPAPSASGAPDFSAMTDQELSDWIAKNAN